jgi:hypothetical protein
MQWQLSSSSGSSMQQCGVDLLEYCERKGDGLPPHGLEAGWHSLWFEALPRMIQRAAGIEVMCSSAVWLARKLQQR